MKTASIIQMFFYPWEVNFMKKRVASIDAGVVQNPDGTTDVYFSAKLPKGKEAN